MTATVTAATECQSRAIHLVAPPGGMNTALTAEATDREAGDIQELAEIRVPARLSDSNLAKAGVRASLPRPPGRPMARLGLRLFSCRLPA